MVTASVLHILNGIATSLYPLIIAERRGENLAGIGTMVSLFHLFGLAGSVCIVAAAFIGRSSHSHVARTSTGNS